jgi:hypoxanthine phosphoribosyltransferase
MTEQITQVTYKQVVGDAELLAFKIVDKKEKYKAVHPIPSGGIAIGTIISQMLDLPMISVEEYKQYKNKKEVLVVDDLVDSGKTLLRYKESDCAVLYKKPHSPKPTYHLKDIGSNWVIFPHEKDKDGILDHLVRVFEFIDIRLNEKEEQTLLDILNKIKHER